MPSVKHEGIVELFRNQPVLAVEMLREVFGLTIPQFTSTRIEPADLGEVIPRELRADLVVLLLDETPVMVIIVEAQLSYPKKEKPSPWPGYVVGGYSRYHCQACLLVVTPDGALAAYLARPIVLGPGSVITPHVLGPSGIPVVVDIQEAQERPELAVLSAIAHGQTETGLEVAVAALLASAGINDEEKRALYADLVLYSLGEAARRALEVIMSMRNYEYQSEFARTYFQQGREKGREEGIEKGIEKGRLEPLVHQFERRLRRVLTPEERARLVERVRVQGAEQVSDVVLDLSAEELATWLDATSGH